VSRLAREHVTVVLSGDGGDELFAGYTRYADIAQRDFNQGAPAWRAISQLGRLALLAGELVSAVLPPRLRERALRWSARAKHSRMEEVYRSMVSQGFDPALAMVHNSEKPEAWWNAALAEAFPEAIERCQMIDTLTYLPDDVLVKVDRASMAYSMEVRSPLLDHRVVTYAWHLPLSLKIRQLRQKWVLRKVLERYVPNQVGIAPRWGSVCQSTLGSGGHCGLGPRTCSIQPGCGRMAFFDVQLVRSYWQRHLMGESWQYPLWCVLMFQAWKRRWIDRPRRAMAA
jgi:asparagine synthase (glutamine-hydrolysing)